MAFLFGTFLLAFAAALATTPLVRRLAIRAGAIDHALSSRKVHGRPIPRLGGLAIVVAFFLPLAVLQSSSEELSRLLADESRRMLFFAGGALAIALLGVFDDIRGANAWKKFGVQVAVAVAMWWGGFRVEQVATPWGDLDPGWLGLPLTLLWITGVTNALNLIDGLDGLAGGVSLAAVSALFWVSYDAGAMIVALFAASLGGALLGFLRYNLHPASIFMGDTGSLFVGFVLATASLEAHAPSTPAVSLIVPLVALGLPIGDTLLAMTRRALRGQALFTSDRGHIHHRLMDLGLSHGRTVVALYLLGLVLAAIAVGLRGADGLQTVAFVAAVMGLALALLFAAGYLRPTRPETILDHRRRTMAMRASVRHAATRMHRASSAEEMWRAVREAALDLGASCAALAVVERNGTTRRTEFSAGFDQALGRLLRTTFSLRGERPDDGGIELGFTDGRTSLDRDTEICAELLAEHVRAAVERLDALRHVEQGQGGVVVKLRN